MPTRPDTGFCAVFLLLAVIANNSVQADSTWFDPHPQRLDAFVEGRSFTYNWESFIHRLSYRHLSNFPLPAEDGLYGTGGSTTGDELYLDINLQKTLYTDNERYGVVVRMQQREDFDGRFERQLLGVSRRFNNNWNVILLADVAGDKGRISFQYEVSWRPHDDQLLRVALIETDRFYNPKSNSNNRYLKEPITAFLHYRQSIADTGLLEFAINYSPQASYAEQSAGQLIRSEQLRLMANMQMPLNASWQSGLRIELEQTDRSIASLAGAALFDENFRRRMQRYTWSAHNSTMRFSPEFGLQYFRLSERGWFGNNLAASGDNQRREFLAYLGGIVRERERSYWQPTLYVGNIDFDNSFVQRPLDNRQREDIAAKLALPWRYVVHQQSGAILSINTTFRLHTLAFGGANVQLHWPF
jgi:hypothetical protein